MAAIKALQQWCKQQCDGYRDVTITNMTTSFRDGLAFCAILHKHRPDLINFTSLSKENVYENNALAFRVAEEQLGIPALLDAEDMVQLRVPDRLSILTYVSQYYNYFHGRSPIGGIGAVKRPPPDTIEEPAGKKITNHVPVSPQTKSSPQPEWRSTAVIENAPVRAGIREINPNSAVSSNCAICGKHVHLVQRHMADGKLYHRNCFRCKQCTRTLQPGSYKPGDHPGTLVCKNHSESPSPTVTKASSSGPYAPAVSSVGGYSSPVATSQPSSTPTSNPTSRPWYSTTSPSVPAPSNRAAVGFVSNNKSTTSVPSTASQEPSNKITHNFQSTIIKEAQNPASTTNHVPTNRTAVGFYGNSKANSNVSSGSGMPEQLNKPALGNLGNNKDRTVSSVPSPAAHTQQTNSPAAGYLQAIKGKTDNTNSSSPQNNSSQKEAKKELGHAGQQSKMTGSAGNVISVSSLSSGRWSSPATKDETKEQSTSPKPWLSSTAKNKEARDKFFQSKPVTEPSANQSPAGRESPKISVSNGPGRSVAINVTPCTPEANPDKDKARNFLLKAIPGSTSPKTVQAAESPNSISTPNRILNPQQSGTPSSTPKPEPVKPVPKERKGKVPTTVSSPEPPKSAPTYTVSKEFGTPSSGKSPVPAKRTQPTQPTRPAQPSVLTPGRVQKADEPSPKTQTPGASVSKSEAPEGWRSMLKSVDKKPAIQRTLHEAKPTPREQETATAQKKQTTVTTVTVTISPSPAAKDSNPTPPTVSIVTPSLVVTESTNVTTPQRRKLLPAKIDLINDWPKPEQKWQDGVLVNMDEAPKWRPHLTDKGTTIAGKTSTGNVKPSSPSWVGNNNVASSNKLRPEYIPEEDIQRQLHIIEQELDTLEQRGVELEKQLRSCDGDESEDSLMVDWFKLIHEKQLLLRQESELNYISKQQALEDQQQDVETELRNLMNKPEHLKSARDKTRESELLEKYLLIVNDRSEIIECLDEDRLREKEEDEMMENMIKKHSDPQQKQPSPEPNLKRRSRFSFSGWLKPKDKNKT